MGASGWIESIIVLFGRFSWRIAGLEGRIGGWGNGRSGGIDPGSVAAEMLLRCRRRIGAASAQQKEAAVYKVSQGGGFHETKIIGKPEVSKGFLSVLPHPFVRRNVDLFLS